MKDCPFYELGCMFKHAVAPGCNYLSLCNRKLCQFQHKTNEIEQAHFKCPNCDNRASSEQELDLHKLSAHNQTDELKENVPCTKCNYVFKTKDKFTHHLSGMQHNRVEKKDESEYEDDSDDDEEYLDECGYCDIVLTSYEATINHQSNYLRCEKCEVCFHNEFQWDDHDSCDRYA